MKFFLLKKNLTVTAAKKFVKWVLMDAGIVQNVFLRYVGHVIKEANSYGRLIPKKRNANRNYKK
jgi:hypothetical protein